MEEKKVSKITVRIDNSDGTFTESKDYMPYEIAYDIMIQILEWRDRWMATFSDAENYESEEKKFKEKLNTNDKH